MDSYSYCAEIYCAHQKKKDHGDLVNSKNGENVLLSELKELLKNVKW